jgi:MoaA/NifB/PqqE/SkfB family radical SAM enzyme
MAPRENLARARHAFEARALVVDHFPAKLTIEPTSICNLRCVMCPHAIGGVHRPKHMPQEIFDKLRVPMAYVQWAQLNGIGEPLASPAFWHALENNYLGPEAEVYFNTNMVLLDEGRLNRLINTKARLTLNISLDAATPLTYRRIRGADFEKVTANIRQLREARGEHYYPVIMLNMTLMRENIEEVVAFLELAKELDVNSISFWHLNYMPENDMARFSVDRDNWHFEYSQQGLWNFPTLSNRMLKAALQRAQELGIPLYFDESKNAFFDETAGEPELIESDVSSESIESSKIETVKDCRRAWEELVVTSEGAVRACCFSQPIGNLNEADFDSIWNGKAMQNLRRDIANNEINEVCRNAACKYVSNMKLSEDKSPFVAVNIDQDQEFEFKSIIIKHELMQSFTKTLRKLFVGFKVWQNKMI